MLKVCLVTPLPPFESGISYYSRYLCLELSRLCETIIVSQKGAHLLFRKQYNVWRRGFLAPLNILLFLKKIRANLVHVQFDYAVYGPPMISLMVPLMVKILLRKPLIVTVHEVPPIYAPLRIYEADNLSLKLFVRYRFVRYLLVKITVFTLNLADKIIVHNDLMAKQLKKYGVKEEKITVIPHGSKEYGKQRYGACRSRKEFRILYIGFLRPSKGIEYLLLAFKRVLELLCGREKAKLVIIGGKPVNQTTPYVEKIRKLVEALKLSKNVELLGFLGEEEFRRNVLEADVIVLPYVDFFIGSSGVFHSVCVSGKPIICTRIPRFYAELDGNECIMVKPRCSLELAEAMCNLLVNSNLREKISKLLVNKFAETVWCKVAKEHITHYYRLIRKEVGK
ncbi:MAG: hypothetical protein B6U76_00515 [Desulfurococcales archaeon ex4484_217_2]|nr:MAG: hypothetical protein B6U76_00515 [Desulfurococcales archaeon ex4484_217_2]